MSIGSCDRSTPAATSVTSAVAGSCSCGAGDRPSRDRTVRDGGGDGLGAACHRVGPGGSCCGAPVRCRRPRPDRPWPSSCRPGTRPRPSRPCWRRSSPSCDPATSSSSSTTTRTTRRPPSPRPAAQPWWPRRPCPAGWIGKPHACWAGAAATTAPLVVFVDADVRPGRELLDGLAAALAAGRRGRVGPAVARRRAPRRTGGGSWPTSSP